MSKNCKIGRAVFSSTSKCFEPAVTAWVLAWKLEGHISYNLSGVRLKLCTHAKNATTHPRAIVLAAQGKQRTKAEKEANNNHAALEKAAAEKVKEERIISIAKLIMQLHEEQNTATPESGASSARGLNSKPSASRAADQGQAQNTTRVQYLK
ncbi:hypothetical protein HD554DRAFT_2035685 [Boletus coccyginus]|nr:hypothetical protein HD554DRAFT_2035685 [Boletus coccyginus]